MNFKLMINALFKYICGLLLVGMLLFLPAGSLRYTAAWRMIVLLFAPILALGVFLLLKAPELLKKRLSARESQTAQRRVVGISALGFMAGFIAAGLDFRFGISAVPAWLQYAASVLLLVSYGLYAEVMRENAWLSRTVEVQQGQRVVVTGLYGIVRHPMYAATLLLFLSMPLALGSWISLAIFLHYPVLIVLRILNEEKLLCAELQGYDAYCKKVKYRLLPFIW